jgi:hypothetical protein
MGRAEIRADFSGALSAIVVIALVIATTAVMVVTLNTAGAAGESAAGACGAYAMAPASCDSATGRLISLSLLTK